MASCMCSRQTCAWERCARIDAFVRSGAGLPKTRGLVGWDACVTKRPLGLQQGSCCVKAAALLAGRGQTGIMMGKGRHAQPASDAAGAQGLHHACVAPTGLQCARPPAALRRRAVRQETAWGTAPFPSFPHSALADVWGMQPALSRLFGLSSWAGLRVAHAALCPWFCLQACVLFSVSRPGAWWWPAVHQGQQVWHCEAHI